MPDPVRDLCRTVRHRLAEAGDPDRAPQMQAYMKSAMPFRGVAAPEQHRIFKDVLGACVLPDRASWEVAVRTLWDEAAFREERYAALAVAGHKAYRGYQDPSTLPLYRHLVETGAWWDYVDVIASHRVGDLLRSHPDEVTPVLRAWAQDEDLWVRRTAILSQLRSKDRTDTALLTDVLAGNLEPSLHGKEFFVRKAVGWALREYAKTDPAWVRSFVSTYTGEMAGLSRREALKNIGA